jgi:hypothetical protein
MTVYEFAAKIWVLISIISYGSVVHRNGVLAWLKACYFNTPTLSHIPDTSNPHETPELVSDVSEISSQKTLGRSEKNMG